MDWIIFGDDWGRHPSTTQHLVSHFRENDRILWIDSIGMRSPKLSVTDGARAVRKLKSMLSGRITPGDLGENVLSMERHGKRAPDRVMMPAILPWHVRCAGVNAHILARAIKTTSAALGLEDVTILSATPLAALYLDAIPHERVVYLRLDDYARLPGVDAELVNKIEPRLIERADLVVATAKKLLPEPWRYPSTKTLYLPQGVDFEHFAMRIHRPVPGRPVLGFFGLFAEWIDADLIREVALAKPDWTLEFLGPRRDVPASLEKIENIVFRDAVDYAALPQAIEHWSAAWIPFEVSELTAAVNPLKLREYLSAGLPTACVEMPEVDFARFSIERITGAADVVSWLEKLAKHPETTAVRLQRARSMRTESWAARAERLRTATARIAMRGHHVRQEIHTDFSRRLSVRAR